MSTENATVAFFGATGGCSFAALVRTLEAGMKVNALARTPSKLEKQLRDRGVSQEVISQQLRITSGNVKEVSAVEQTLLSSGGTSNTPQRMVDLIVSGIGSLPKLQFNLYPVTLYDPTICADATRTIMSALQNIQKKQGASDPPANVQRPTLVIISTTGVSKKQRDVPWAFYFLYHWLLAVPHKDKAESEAIVDDTVANNEGAGPISGFVALRPTLLMDGDAAETKDTRVGWEWSDRASDLKTREEKAPGPALGYTITRETVGRWIFEKMVRADKATRRTWEGKMVTLTE